MPLEDKHANKIIRSVFTKRGVDTSFLDIRVSNGIVYLRGPVGFMPGHVPVDPKSEMANIVRILRHQPSIRDVVTELTFK